MKHVQQPDSWSCAACCKTDHPSYTARLSGTNGDFHAVGNTREGAIEDLFDKIGRSDGVFYVVTGAIADDWSVDQRRLHHVEIYGGEISVEGEKI